MASLTRLMPLYPSLSFTSFRQALRQWVVFPFLFPLFYVLHIARYYCGAVPASDVLLISAGWMLLTWLLYWLLRIFIKNRLAAGVAALLLTVLTGCWYKILNPLLRAFHTGENYNRLPWIFMGFLALIAALAFAAGRLKERAASAMLYYLNTLFALFIAAELLLIGFYALQGRPGPLIKNPAEQAIDASATPGGNIYLLLCDEYASTAVLREKWGFDNSAMDSFLKSRGFFVNAHSRSNYCWTEFSMASLLNMDYFRHFRSPHNTANYQDIQRAIVAIENPRVVQVLKQAGYAIKPYSIFQVDSQAAEYIPELRLNKGRLITASSLFHAMRINYLPYLRHRAEIKANPDYHFPPFYRMNEYNDEGVRKVLHEASLHESKPKFVYAHFFMPHDTYYYDSAGLLMPMERIKNIPKAEEPRYYYYNMRHANGKLRQMVNSIQANDPGASIIVLGDHGYRQHLYQDDRYPEYFRNMSAIYFPDKDYRSLPDSFTNVNVFRLVLNKVCGTHYSLLPDKSCPLTLAH
jgi:hypothetical protein